MRWLVVYFNWPHKIETKHSNWEQKLPNFIYISCGRRYRCRLMQYCRWKTQHFVFFVSLSLRCRSRIYSVIHSWNTYVSFSFRLLCFFRGFLFYFRNFVRRFSNLVFLMVTQISVVCTLRAAVCFVRSKERNADGLSMVWTRCEKRHWKLFVCNSAFMWRKISHGLASNVAIRQLLNEFVFFSIQTKRKQRKWP